ncbi:MAG TPA: filamentous hemagglutinin N-terminal domain-containing protein [Patescibacteria group bacterium]|nr:filamentous hemagglutinin N-terminal domain-containing protein [Patescibacteria group bacterium]
MNTSWFRPRRVSLLGLILWRSWAVPAPAQIVLDGKFGSSGPLSGPNYTITPGMGATRGNNLFHSFSQFNLQAGESANFTGPANIQNILSRVTGGTASTINGTIGSDIPGANLFFINPNGVIFGANASVNVSGSFAVSTANYLKLADGARFVASLDADDSKLSTAPVSAFGFLGNHSGTIAVNQSTLKVPDGQTISIIGGDITADGGSVQAPQGQINVVSVRSAGEVPVEPTSLSAAGFKTAFPQQGEIGLKNLSSLDASGDGGGRIVIRGGKLTVEGSTIQANTTGTGDGKGIDVSVTGDLDLIKGGQIKSISTAGLGAGGDITVNAQSIRLNGGGLVDENFFPSTQISTSTGDPFQGGGSGRGGDIVIKAGSLELANSAQISSATFDAGNAGRIDITAGSVRVDALLTTITQISANSQQSDGGGNAGDIILHAGTLDMLNGATMFAATFGSGQAGLIDIKASTVNLLSAAIITAGTFGSGKGGNVQVNANLLNIDGRNLLNGGPDFLTGIQAVTTSFDSAAPGGSIHVNAGTLQMDHMGSLFTSSFGIGQGGNIEVKAAQANLANGSTISAEGGSGDGATGAAGHIFLSIDGDLRLTQKSAISTSAPVSSGGDISVNTGNQLLLTDSEITAQAGPGGGGNITLKAPSMIYLLNSTLTAQAVGDGGNLSIIDPVFFILNNGGLISKSSSANGGNIGIFSDFFFPSTITIDASAPFGLPGTVSVSAPQVDLSGSLVALPANLLDAATQLRPDCAVRLSGNVSSFIVLGRGGLPVAPGGFVPSAIVTPLNEAR